MAQLSGSARIDQYTATAGQTTFTYTFEIGEDSEIKVQQNDTTLTLTTHYTVTGAGEAGGGTVVLVTGATLDDVITLTGNTIVKRDTTFTEGGDFAAASINAEFDRLDELISEVITDQSQNMSLKIYTPTFNPSVPAPVANKCLTVNAAGTGWEMSTYDPDTQVATAVASATAASASAALAGTKADTATLQAENAATYAANAANSAASINLDALGSSIVPATDSSINLGSSSKKFATIYVDTIDGLNPYLLGQGTAQFRHVSNDHGGASSASSYTTRPISSTVSNTINGMSLSSNAITFPAGTYIFNAVMSKYQVGATKWAWRDSTPTTYWEQYVGYTLAELSETLTGIVTFASETTCTMDMWASLTDPYGMGRDHGSANQHLDIIITKVG